MARTRLVAAHARVGTACQEEPAIGRLPQAAYFFILSAAERFVPKLVSVPVQAHDPEIVTAEVGTGLDATGRGGRRAAEDKPAVARWLRSEERRVGTEGRWRV